MSPEERRSFPTSIDAIIAVEGILAGYREDRWSETLEMVQAVVAANGEEGLRNALMLYADTLSCLAATQMNATSSEVRRVVRETIVHDRIAEDDSELDG